MNDNWKRHIDWKKWPLVPFDEVEKYKSRIPEAVWNEMHEDPPSASFGLRIHTETGMLWVVCTQGQGEVWVWREDDDD